MLDDKYEKLITYMETGKPFLETNLNLQSLAKLVDMKPHFLSMLINQKSSRNFFDFVNTFRINEFKEQVLDPSNQHYTLLSIAYSCGFNSKTAFNRAFKNITGKTPSEYYHQAIQRQNS
jgi:transcriptional regulator GlxA family with amidase domain